jgi:hypothetical protein
LKEHEEASDYIATLRLNYYKKQLKIEKKWLFFIKNWLFIRTTFFIYNI